MKRILSILLALLLLSACGAKENPQSRSEKNPSSSQSGGKMASGGGELSGSPLKGGSSEELLSIAADFAVNFPYAFSSPDELNVTRFCLLKIYDEDPAAVDEAGILWVGPERLTAEVERRFDISDYQFQSPEQENVYPRYVEEKGAIAFYPAGEFPRYAVELAGQKAEGEYYDYIFDVYDDFITDGHEERTLETTLRYRFRVVGSADGAPFLQAVSAVDVGSEPTNPPESPSSGGEAEPEGNGSPQSDGQSVIENIPQEEQQSYFRKYIQPYYIAGLMYSTWSDPSALDGKPLEPWQYLRFYICNESENYWNEHPADDAFSIPTDIVENYLFNYFNVDWRYLHTAENYDPDIGCYLSMHTEGIGGGPGVTIERIEKSGDHWRFVCRDEGGNQPSVTIRMLDENTFRYVAGEGPSL